MARRRGNQTHSRKVKICRYRPNRSCGIDLRGGLSLQRRQGLDLAGDRDLRVAGVGDQCQVELELAALWRDPLAADNRGLGDVLPRGRQQIRVLLAGGPERWPTIVSMLVFWMASAIAWGSPRPARCRTLTATSNRAWNGPIGCVHWRCVWLMYCAANSAQVWPVSDDLNGQVGCHQTSLARPAGEGVSTSMKAGNSSALPTVAIFGRNWSASASRQKVAKSGGCGLPVRICASWAMKLCSSLLKSLAPSTGRGSWTKA